jgi:pilus assembly protein CpaB
MGPLKRTGQIMKGKAVIPLVLGLCVGLVAVKFLVDAVQKARGSTSEIETFQVVRAKLDIDSFQKITEESIELVETADTAFAPTHQRFSSLEEVVGQVTAKAIPQNAPVLKSMLAPEGTPPGMQGMVKEGFRAVSVRTDEVTGVAYQLKPGNWVDVIVVMDVSTGSGRRGKETVAEVILQRVQIAAIGRATTGASSESGSKMKPAKSATLLVREEDVPKLHLAATRGKLTLAMRGDDDKTKAKPITARGSEVFDSEGRLKKPEPAKNGDGRSLLGAFFAQAANPAHPMPDPKPEVQNVRRPDPAHGVTVVTGNPEGQVDISQTVFANANSRVIVGVSQSVIKKPDGSIGATSKRTKASRQARGETVRPNPQTSEPKNDSDFEEAE